MRKSILGILIAGVLVFSASAKPLVVYFSVPETTKTSGLSRDEENSVVVVNGKALGNVQYVAEIIAEETGADIFRLEPADAYPTNHNALIKRVADEQQKNVRPEIKDRVNLSSYDTIFIGYPIWNADLPPILYSFFGEYDLAGKKVYAFTVHGGSGLVRTVQSIIAAEPDADVSRDAFAEYRNTVDKARPRVVSWLEEIGAK